MATDADVEAICRVCAAGWRDTDRDTHAAADVDVVAEAEGCVAAAGGGGPAGAGACELYVLDVDPPFQRRGLGSAVLALVTDQGRGHGATRQRVAVAPDNPSGIGFYAGRASSSPVAAPATRPRARRSNRSSWSGRSDRRHQQMRADPEQ